MKNSSVSIIVRILCFKGKFFLHFLDGSSAFFVFLGMN
ncbi:hypothetical protein BACUNI_01967 [Bacteroides uniformis ATCC 8492]|uniref:Uncharacterized protein n=1 Tax=Bacteroides uniformis (strain ATCC 8492 / DSM 6597 / CCUG 4942 / CIP 103695 / JCM 5828 / KCTC 5204 / NCTC 13054 / VPI 0061) TaxID=411479 RepID=A0ABC9ND35_BACUC|nr:hypothetical protein BACUNI_01967 [Bacteroides uniformis ATCC 8492]